MNIIIYLAQKAKVTLLSIDKVLKSILVKYTNFVDIF